MNALHANSQSEQPVSRYQAIWVDAFNPGSATPEQTERMVAIARKHHINTIFFQVCKTGDALYESKLAPKAKGLPAGYDPLKHVLALAHDTTGGKQRIEVHAWLTLFRVSTSSALRAGNALKSHPDWRMISYSGAKSFDNGQLYIDPGVPAVHDHYVEIVRELLRNYPVDGVHLDRIRYPAADAGYNAVALERFIQQYRRTDKPKPDDPQFSDFRRRQISDLVRRLYAECKRSRPHVRMSASVATFGAYSDQFEETPCYKLFYQDWPQWLRNGWLDMCCPMIYKRYSVKQQQQDYKAWLAFCATQANKRHLIVGQGAYLCELAGSLHQIEQALKTSGVDGVSIYSYANPCRKGACDADTALARIVKAGLFDPAGVPRMSWVDQPSYGIITGTAICDKRPLDGARVLIRHGEQIWTTHTDGNGYFAVMNRIPGEYRISIDGLEGKTIRPATVRLLPGQVQYISMPAKTQTVQQ